MDSVTRRWILPGETPVRRPLSLSHIASESCWCEPIVELDEDGEQVVVHREVTWH